MRSGILACLFVAGTAAPLSAVADDNITLRKAAQPAPGVGAAIAGRLGADGYAVASGEGMICEVWLAKNLPLKPAFTPSQSVKYPFQPGQLVGVIRVGDKVDFSDFRGQPIKPGAYTLRYGVQPQDGNHLGTSEVADFLLAIPAADDTDAKPWTAIDKLQKASAKAAGANHPAIFLLLPSDAAPRSAVLVKDDNKRWILSVAADGVSNGKKTPVGLKLVVIGKAEG